MDLQGNPPQLVASQRVVDRSAPARGDEGKLHDLWFQKPGNRSLYGGFLKWWYLTTMGFPTKNHHFGVFGGIPILGNTHISIESWLIICFFGGDPFLMAKK